MHNTTSIHFDIDTTVITRVYDVKNGKAVVVRAGDHEVEFYLRTPEQADAIAGVFGAAFDLDDVLFPGTESESTLPGEGQHSATQPASDDVSERPSERAMRESQPCEPYVRLDGSTWGCEDDYTRAHTTPSNEPQTVDS